jgi:hypothetical protein
MLSIPRLQSFAAQDGPSSLDFRTTDQPASQNSGKTGTTTQAGPQSQSSSSVGPWPIHANPIQADPVESRKHNDVALLDQAEALTQDAFRRVSPFNPNPSASDKLTAQLEMQQAQVIRNQVRPDLDAAQRQQLDQIQGEEQQAFADATSVGGGILGGISRGFAVTKMIDGAAKSKALDNSILGIPNAGPPIPKQWPFGKVS